MNIALLGYGKMGKTIECLALQKGHKVVYKLGSSFSEGDLSQADVAIEFSIPQTAFENIKECLKRGIPIVSGTTGWLNQMDEVLNLCENSNGSFLYASNFSIGVNLFFDLNEKLAKLMQPWNEYVPSVDEIHHTQKLDAPSGTAITIAEGILKYSEKKEWQLDAANENVLSIHADRIKDITGAHTVQYRSKIDTLSIKHEAHSRDGYAMGAIIAAEWLQDKKGVFSMKDVLN